MHALMSRSHALNPIFTLEMPFLDSLRLPAKFEDCLPDWEGKGPLLARRQGCEKTTQPWAQHKKFWQRDRDGIQRYANLWRVRGPPNEVLWGLCYQRKGWEEVSEKILKIACDKAGRHRLFASEGSIWKRRLLLQPNITLSATISSHCT